MTTDNNWTPEKYETAKKLWAEGVPVAEIATIVEIKRNTVISMMGRHREDFPGRVQASTLDKWRDRLPELNDKIRQMTNSGVSAEWMAKHFEVHPKVIRRLQKAIFGAGARAMGRQPTYRRDKASKHHPFDPSQDAANRAASAKLLAWVAKPSPEGGWPTSAATIRPDQCQMPLWGLEMPPPEARYFCGAPVPRNEEGAPCGAWCAFHKAQVFQPTYLQMRANNRLKAVEKQ